MVSLFAGKTHVIFDFDGTIADTFVLHEAAFQNALQSYNLSFAYADYLGMSTNEAIAAIFKNNRRELEQDELNALVQVKRRLANQSYKENLQPIPGALELIHQMHSAGMQLFIGSSGSRMNISAGVQVLQLEPYFTEIVTSDDVKRSKPDPEIFLSVLQRHGVQPAAAIVIEDADSGIEAATRAGIDVVCVNPEVSCHPMPGHNLKCFSYAELQQQFESFLQHEKSFSSDRNL